jgi:hypothetical protein
VPPASTKGTEPGFGGIGDRACDHAKMPACTNTDIHARAIRNGRIRKSMSSGLSHRHIGWRLKVNSAEIEAVSLAESDADSQSEFCLQSYFFLEEMSAGHERAPFALSQ